MGVRGLTTYINHNEYLFLKDFYLHDCNLVIDGHSLCAQLYRMLNCFSAFGGDYDKFYNYVRNFFKNLKKCNVTSYVLFDGSYERRKLKTAYTRLRSKIYGASKLDPVTQSSLQIFPLLIRDVFIEAVNDMNVKNTVCEFEADDEIASLARHLNCPVLSYDSDFFIYNVQYIPFNTLNFKPKPIEIDGTRTHVMECKMYKVEYLVNSFGGLNEELLPLLATLLGNDFIKKKVFKKFFSQLKLPKTKKKTNDQQRCIHGLFKWLQDETLDSAIAKILDRLKKNHKDKILYIIKKSIDGYNRKYCRSLKYFDLEDDFVPDTEWEPSKDIEEHINCSEEEITNEQSSSSEGEDSSSEHEEPVEEDSDIENPLVLGLPEWFSEGIRQNNIPKALINLYTHHLHFCSPQAEDYKDEDSFLCCLPILRYAFDLLTNFAEEHCLYVSRENSNNYKRIYVEKEMSTMKPYEESFSEFTEEQKKFCFYHFVKVNMPNLDLTKIEILPSNLQLFFIAVVWWVLKCEVPLGNIHSLFMSYTMLEAIDEKIGSFRGVMQFNNNYSKKVAELKANPLTVNYDVDELFLNKHKVQYEDCLIAANELLKHFELDEKIQKRPKSYDVRKMHSFAQFQCCLMQFNCLNILCRSPFEPTKYSKCFNGTFVYNLSVKLENQVDPVNFFNQYIKGATTVLMFYKSICNIYVRCAEQMNLTTAKWEGKKKHRKKKAITVEEQELRFIVQGFESEVYI